MYAQVEKPKVNKSRAVAKSVAQKKNNGKQGIAFVDNRSGIITQRRLKGIAQYRPEIQFTGLSGGKNVIQRGNKSSTDKSKDAIILPKLKLYLESSNIEHSEDKDSTAKKYIEMLQKWKNENKLIDYWYTNQSNILEFQRSKYKAMGGACFLLVQSFLKKGIDTPLFTGDVLDKFHSGDISESLNLEHDLQLKIIEAQNIREKLNGNIDKIEIEMNKDEKDRDQGVIKNLFEQNNLLLSERGQVISFLENKLIKEESSQTVNYDPAQVIASIKSLEEGAYELRLQREDDTGHALGIVKTKNFEGEYLYYFMDPSSISFSGGTETLPQIEKVIAMYQKKYVKVKIIKYAKT